MRGNWIDLVILIFLGLYAATGWRRGFFALLADMGSFLGAFLLALKFYTVAAGFLITNFSFSVSIANAVGFLGIAIIAEIVLARLLSSLYRLPKNRFLGLIPAVIDGLIVLAFIITVIISLPVSPLLKRDIINSRLGGNLYSQTVSLEKTLGQIFGGVFVGQENINLRFTTAQTTIDSAGEQEMFNFVNKERAAHGRPLLTLDSGLTSVARAHSKDMFARGYFSHVNPDGADPFDRMRADNIFFLSAGENIAYAPTTSLANTGLINSPEHRDNILSPDFRRVGIGVIDAGIYGKMFSQNFTN